MDTLTLKVLLPRKVLVIVPPTMFIARTMPAHAYRARKNIN